MTAVGVDGKEWASVAGRTVVLIICAGARSM